MPRNLINSDTLIRSIKPDDSRKRLSDGDGLFLLLNFKGGNHAWRFGYTHDGRRNVISFGTYPAVTLAAARRKADEARRLLAEGTDPSEARKRRKQEDAAAKDNEQRAASGLPLRDSFEEVARAWFETRRSEWADSYAEKVIRRLEGLVFPHVGSRPVNEITPPELLRVLRELEARGTVETAHRVRDTCSQVFRFAVAEGRISSDPARDLAGALKAHQTRHIPAIVEPERFAELLRAVDAYRGSPPVRAALRLAPLVFLRPGSELRAAEWAEFDLDRALWQVPAARMKRRKHGKENGPDHVVPLSRQAVEILRDLHRFTGAQHLVFRGERNRAKPISENTLNAALTGMGFGATEMRAHGFRASARTLLVERLGIPAEIVEAQLAHSVPDALGRAYNRTTFTQQRAGMMQAWADYLDRLRSGKE